MKLQEVINDIFDDALAQGAFLKSTNPTKRMQALKFKGKAAFNIHTKQHGVLIFYWIDLMANQQVDIKQLLETYCELSPETDFEKLCRSGAYQINYKFYSIDDDALDFQIANQRTMPAYSEEEVSKFKALSIVY